MRQVVQNLKTGAIELAEVPAPSPRPGEVLIRNQASLISAGTERSTIAVGRQSLLERARKRPEKVLEVLGRVSRDGLGKTIESVQAAFERLQPMGYCSVGTVIGLGEGVRGFQLGDRVASNAPHAEIASVPVNLCTCVPDGVPDAAAAFTLLGAIALQGIRLAQPALGECFAVSGLGVVGLLAVQLLRAQGARVLAIDPVAERRQMAAATGAVTATPEEAEQAALALSRGRGLDGALIATATDSDAPVHQAAQMCRKRGRLVLIGVAGLGLSRADFYEKELTFQVSASYGPGRYDPAYEQHGQDYPAGFVRWTAGRNCEAVLDMLADGRLDVAPLISARVPIDRANDAYGMIAGGGATLGVLFEYPQTAGLARAVPVGAKPAAVTGELRLALIGAGAYAGAVLVPAFRAAGAQFKTVVARGGVDAVALARRFGAEQAATDAAAALADPQIDAVVIATRHDSHARLAVAALEAGKHVFVEKPMALSHAEADAIAAAHANAGDRLLMVGFNRRFAPLTQRVKQALANLTEPRSVIVTVNAGALPAAHWTRDPAIGGGRILGEGCHFVDLMIDLIGQPPSRVAGAALAGADDRLAAVLSFPDGSTGTLHYLSSGHASFPKERVEVFCAGRVLRIDDFRSLDGFGVAGVKGRRQDKGNAACVAAFVAALRQGSAAPVPFAELLASTRATLDLAAAVGQAV